MNATVEIPCAMCILPSIQCNFVACNSGACDARAGGAGAGGGQEGSWCTINQFFFSLILFTSLSATATTRSIHDKLALTRSRGLQRLGRRAAGQEGRGAPSINFLLSYHTLFRNATVEVLCAMCILPSTQLLRLLHLQPTAKRAGERRRRRRSSVGGCVVGHMRQAIVGQCGSTVGCWWLGVQ